MKKNIILAFIFSLIFAGAGFSQDVKLFRFLCNQANSNGDKEVLYHDLTSNNLLAKSAASEEFNSTEGYLEAFIIRKIPHTNYVCLISAKKNSHYLKYNNSTGKLSFAIIKYDLNKLSLLRINRITDERYTLDSDYDAYSWKIKYVGDSHVIISPRDNPNKVLCIKNSEIILDTLKDNNSIPTNLTSEIGNIFKFKMEKILNVL